VVDINEPDIHQTLDDLKKELAEFDHTLLSRPSFVVITKVDTVTECDLKAFCNRLPDDYIYLSAVTHVGAKTFIQEIERRLDQR
jgi:50S ribosomal subunit-associated GTPase HflX